MPGAARTTGTVPAARPVGTRGTREARRPGRVAIRRREARSAGCEGRGISHLAAVVLEAGAQLAAAARRDRPRRAAVGEPDAAGGGEVEQLLALVALARGAHEQPAEEQDGE